MDRDALTSTDPASTVSPGIPRSAAYSHRHHRTATSLQPQQPVGELPYSGACAALPAVCEGVRGAGSGDLHVGAVEPSVHLRPRAADGRALRAGGGGGHAVNLLWRPRFDRGREGGHRRGP